MRHLLSLPFTGFRPSAWALSVVLLAVSSLPSSALNKEVFYEHLRDAYRIPSHIKLELGELRKSDIPGFRKADLKFIVGSRSKNETVYIHDNGRHYLMGEFNDLRINPVHERLKKMKISGAAIRGNMKATVTLVEYTDFQCPYCRVGYQIVRDQILKEYPKDVRWVYKSFPLKSIHPWAEPAAIAVECARKESLEGFWKLHDVFFDKQREIRASNMDDKFIELAKEVGVHSKKFQACYDGKKSLSQVRADMSEADKLGISSTPTFVVNGRLVPGASYKALKSAVEDALKKAGK